MTAPCITRHEVTEFEKIGMATFPSDVVEAYATKYGFTIEMARHHARELVRYLTMCHLNPEVEYGMAGQVDEVWHLFMLDSIPYTMWCDEVFGYYMHHVPTKPADKLRQQTGELTNSYVTFVERYSLFFGESPDFAMWPAIHGSSCGGGSSCSSSSCSTPSSCGSACSGGTGTGTGTKKKKKKKRFVGESSCHLPTEECVSCNPLFKTVAA